jgi:cysteine desulfurase
MKTPGSERIYLDFNATTPVAPEVAEVISRFAATPFGNPSSTHWAGAPAHEAVERARKQVAALLHCSPAEVVFTSGGSEANNYALKGVYFTRNRDAHIITTTVEHPAIHNPCRFLEKLGASITYVPVDHFGRVDPDDVARAITTRTAIISVMHANNEVGTLQPIADIARIAREHGVLFHTDAAQSVGKLPMFVDDLGVDMLSLAGHKMYAPKGVGVLYVRNGIRLEPLIHGAGHESGRRAGTENVLLDVALGAACEFAQSWVTSNTIRELRDVFWEKLRAQFGERVALNGHPTERLPNTLNVSFIGKNGADVLARLPNLAASTGSACHSGSVQISPVLKAMGIEPESGLGAIRLSLGRTTTRQEIEQTVDWLSELI